ncbi:hypothetical protein J2T56_003124 [Natronobacillus azotifigens]|uniref:Uncharacterized protein n=1 Tax=Natronobacillus azotifigens TaxID=472978 RepID=A0A9J6R8S0_9BACI|nr:hypothetical protein [Natronobacillus azotifigens]MCZ0702021.1 hypothetical protein [Natronobacillus azotifigens]
MKKLIVTGSMVLLILFGWIVLKPTDDPGLDYALIFGRNYISYNLDNEDVRFNIFGVLENGGNLEALDQLITDVAFNNTNMSIVDYHFDQAEAQGDYQLFNLLINVESSSNQIESSDRFIISFKDGKSREYEFGKAVVTNINADNEIIDFPNQITVSYPYLSLNMEIHNVSSEDIVLTGITDLANQISYSFEPEEQIQSNQKYQIDIDFADEVESYDFHTLTPLLNYMYDQTHQTAVMHGMIYGMFRPDEEKIELILANHNKVKLQSVGVFSYSPN